MTEYKPRGMPARFMDGAPDVVKRNVIDILAIVPAAPLDYDIVFRQHDTPRGGAAYGLDFGTYGGQGCHFYLTNHEMRAYRERNRRKRVAWRDLPEATRKAIVAYLESE